MDELSPQPILDGELLRAFAIFATELNFTRAAKRTALSQPALFDRVRRLSEQLGARLYVKQGRSLALTAQGRQLAAFARDLLARTRSFTDELRGGETAARVSLAAGEGAYLYLLTEALARFTRHTRAELRVLTLGGPDACEAVQSGEAHLAVGVFDLIPRGLLSREICTAPLCAALPLRHPLARKKAVALRSLMGEQLILAPEGQKQRDIIGRAMGSLGGLGVPPIDADGWPLMLAFVASGLGIAVVNGICRPPPGVVLRPIPELGTITYRLLSRKSAAPNAAQDALAAGILERHSEHSRHAPHTSRVAKGPK